MFVYLNCLRCLWVAWCLLPIGWISGLQQLYHSCIWKRRRGNLKWPITAEKSININMFPPRPPPRQNTSAHPVTSVYSHYRSLKVSRSVHSRATHRAALSSHQSRHGNCGWQLKPQMLWLLYRMVFFFNHYLNIHIHIFNINKLFFSLFLFQLIKVQR